MTIKTTTQGESIVKLQTDVSYIKKTLDEQTDKLDKFIGAVDNKYATKERVEALEKVFESHQISSAGWIKSVIPWVMMGTALILSIITLVSK